MMMNADENLNLEEENRCDTHINAATKKIWATQLKIFRAFENICEKHSLNYFAGFGTLLGAIRHKGFIPWDNDLDVCMPRRDYDKFMEIAQRELPDYLFLQTSKTDPEYSLGFAKIRDSRTSALEPYYIKEMWHFNMGIYIDIFPLDGYRNRFTSRLQVWLMRFLLSIQRKYYQRIQNSLQSRIKKIVGTIVYFLVGGASGAFRLQQLVARISPLKNNHSCIVMGTHNSTGSCFTWVQDRYDDVVLVPFEKTTIKVPAEYISVLDQVYGDWHIFVRGGGSHTIELIDADVPYQEALKKFGY